MSDYSTTHYSLADLKARHLTETGYEIDGIYRLAGWVKRRCLDGRTYLQLRLADLSGHMECYGWLSQLQQALHLGYCDLVHVKGLLREQNGETVADLEALDAVGTQHLRDHPLLYTLPLIISPLPDALLELASLIDRVEHPGLRQLVRDVVETPEFAPSFVTASVSQHATHAYPGGLLQHTLEVVWTLHALPGLSQPHREVVMVAGLLHDIGKIWTPWRDEMGHPALQETLTLEACTKALGTLSVDWPDIAEALWDIWTMPLQGKPIEQKGMTALAHAVQMADWLSAENHPALPIIHPMPAQPASGRRRPKPSAN